MPSSSKPLKPLKPDILVDQTPRAKPVKVGDSTIDIDAYLTRDYGDISEASEVLPGLIEYISQEYEYAVEEKLNLRLDMRMRNAEVFRDIRKPGVWEQCGFSGKITEKGVEAAIALDEDMTTLTEKYNRKVARCGRLVTMMATLQVKLDMVRSVEATKRKLVPGMLGPADRAGFDEDYSEPRTPRTEDADHE